MTVAEIPVMPLTAGFETDPVAFLARQHAAYGDVFAIELDGLPTAVFGGEAGTRVLFAAERQHLRVANTPEVGALFGEAVFNLAGDAHRQARRAVLAAVTGSWLREIRPDISRLIHRHVQRWGETGKIDLLAACRRLTLTVCAETIMGLPHRGAERRAFPHLFDTFAAAAGDPAVGDLALYDGFEAALQLRTMIARRVFGDRPYGADVLSRLIRAGQVPAASIADHLLAVMIATRETTASLLTWMLLELARKVELAVSAAAGATAREVLQWVLWETERLHSPNTLSRRRVLADLATPAGLVPAGWHAAYSPAANHLLPEFFDDPYHFRPHRFAGVEAPHASSLYTFGRGAHACPGKPFAEMLVTLVVSQVVKRFRLSLTDEAPASARYWPVRIPDAPVHLLLDPWDRR